MMGKLRVSGPFVKHFFTLNNETKLHLYSLTPKFGFGLYGETVFYRTYSRIKRDYDIEGNDITKKDLQENWADVVIRVTEGVLSVRKNHYINNHLGWDDEDWQEFAREFAEYIFHMRILPPGRGLWACGTKFMYERGSAALNNCGAATTKDLILGVIWTMDMLMCGCGIGFDTLWNGKCHNACKDKTYTYIIPDSREGWIESVGLLLLSYIDKSETIWIPDFKIPEGGKFPIFDYSEIRDEGEPIRGFGGVASGYKPLEKLHKRIELFMDTYLNFQKLEQSKGLDEDFIETKKYQIFLDLAKGLGKNLKISQQDYDMFGKFQTYLNENKSTIYNLSIITDDDFDILYEKTGMTKEQYKNRFQLKEAYDFRNNVKDKTYGLTRLIVDFMNAVGACVVAGNVRRSAMIALGETGDDEFLNLKNYNLNPERDCIGWMSNNTVRFKRSEDFHEHIPDISKRIKDNGEPGFYNQLNVQRFGRVGRRPYPSDMWTRENEKDEATLCNPCITGDSLILTNNGLIKVTDLVGQKYTAIVNGKEYPSTEKGFWSNGIKDVYEITLNNGMSIKATNNHKFLKKNTEENVWVEVKDLNIGEYLMCPTNNDYKWENGEDNEEEGYINGKIVKCCKNPHNYYKFIKSIKEYVEYRKLTGRNLECFEFKKCIKEIQQIARSIGINTKIINNNNIDFIDEDLKDNYKIVSIKHVGSEEVYDCTIPGPHCFLANGIITHNCSEIPLEPFELCNLAEIFPTKCLNSKGEFDEEIYYKACRFAAFYTATVSLLPTHWTITNAVIARNRRTGSSMSGVADFYDKYGFSRLTRICRLGYKEIRTENKRLAKQAGVCESIRVTTNKPSGTLSSISGVSPGVHFPTFKYAIRRMRAAENHKICDVLRQAKVPCEKDTYSDNTLVFEFPIDQGKTRAAKEVTIWEQFNILTSLQREWSDNMVSVTIYFNPETEGDQIELALAQNAPQIKSCSMLPHTEEGVYAQAPYQGINEEKYLELKSNLGNIDWRKYSGYDGIMPRFCTNDTCIL